MNVIFESENIYYTKVSIDLIDDYLEMVNDINVNKLISKKIKTYTRDDEIKWINKQLEENTLEFSMIEKHTGKFIGNISFKNVENEVAELGIAITSTMQNQHYGTEAIGAMIKYGFEKLNYKEIVLIVFSNNARAIHCYKKLGFEEYKVDENVAVIDGEQVNDIHMKIHK